MSEISACHEAGHAFMAIAESPLSHGHGHSRHAGLPADGLGRDRCCRGRRASGQSTALEMTFRNAGKITSLFLFAIITLDVAASFPVTSASYRHWLA